MWKLYLVFNKSVDTVRNRPLKRYDKTTAIMSSLKVSPYRMFLIRNLVSNSEQPWPTRPTLLVNRQGRIQRGGPGGPDPPSGPMMSIITINTPVACT